MQTFRKFFTVLSLAALMAVSVPATSYADDSGTESGDELAVAFDLLVLRPAGVVMTTVGLVLFVGSIPMSLATLSVGKSFNALVVGPARYTFVRTLGEESIIP